MKGEDPAQPIFIGYLVAKQYPVYNFPLSHQHIPAERVPWRSRSPAGSNGLDGGQWSNTLRVFWRMILFFLLGWIAYHQFSMNLSTWASGKG